MHNEMNRWVRSALRALSSALISALAITILTGCASAPPPPEPYPEITARITAGEEVSAEALRASFIAADDLPERLQRLAPLERQVLQMIEDEPLRLGSIGSAILDAYYGSLAGHYAMKTYYDRVESEDASALHSAWLERLSGAIENSGDGGRDAPYVVLSASEAETWLRLADRSVVGTLYQTSDELPFGLVTLSKPTDGPLETKTFDLQIAYDAVRRQAEGPDGGDFSPELLIRFLAGQNDSAAQAAIGTFFALSGDGESAINWLHASSRSGNVLANLMLARVHWQRADAAEGELRKTEFDAVLDNYLHAIALGSDEAMLRLGTLYIGGVYGEDNVASGLPLLEQADTLGNADAAMYLGHLYYAGDTVERDIERADGYYRRGAENGNVRTRATYVRFLLDDDAEAFASEQAIDWLREVADGDAQANVLLGYANARGLGIQQNLRAAKNSFRAAVDAAPDDADIVNEVAWTLTVSQYDALRDERYALGIMTTMMESNPTARQNPAFIDTWAAAHAANGEFKRAIELQTEALAAAREGEDEDVIAELESHLELFNAGDVVIDPIP